MNSLPKSLLPKILDGAANHFAEYLKGPWQAHVHIQPDGSLDGSVVIERGPDRFELACDARACTLWKSVQVMPPQASGFSFFLGCTSHTPVPEVIDIPVGEFSVDAVQLSAKDSAGEVAGDASVATSDSPDNQDAQGEVATAEIAAEVAPEVAAEILPPLDSDKDGIPDKDDNCPTIKNPDQANSDSLPDGGDLCDVCPATPNPPEVGACDPTLVAKQLCDAKGCTLDIPGQVTLKIPPNALAKPTSISITANPQLSGGMGVFDLRENSQPPTIITAWFFRPLGTQFTPCNKQKTDKETVQNGCAEGTFSWPDADNDGCVDWHNLAANCGIGNGNNVAELWLTVFRNGELYSCACHSELEPVDLSNGGCTPFPEPNGNGCAENTGGYPNQDNPSKNNSFTFRIQSF